MIQDYKATKSPGIEIYFFSLTMLVIAIFVYIGYEMGYSSARADYSVPTKYRCHEGVVYRFVEGMWQKTNTECKKLEEIK